MVEKALADELRLSEPMPFYQTATFASAFRSLYRDDPQRVRTLLTERPVFADAGGDHTNGYALPVMVTAEWLLGLWDSGLAHARATVEFAAQTHDPQYAVLAGWSSAVLYADVGRVDMKARAMATAGVEAASGIGDEMSRPGRDRGARACRQPEPGDSERAARYLREVPERML